MWRYRGRYLHSVAGVGMSSSPSEINRSWGAGWGVRLLDRFVRDNHETKHETKAGAEGGAR